MNAAEFADAIETQLEAKGHLDALQYFRSLRAMVGPSEAVRIALPEVPR